MKPRPSQATATKFEKRREEILRRSSVLFAERGCNGVSLREIADLFGIHMATLYHYFPDKASLYSAVVARAWEQSADIVMACARGEDTPTGKIRRVLNDSIDYFANNTPEARILDRELILDGAVASGSLQHRLPDYALQSTATLAKFIKDLGPPSMRYFDEYKLALLFFSITHGTIRHRPLYNNHYPNEPDPKNIVLKRDIFILIEQVLGLPVGHFGQNEPQIPTLDPAESVAARAKGQPRDSRPPRTKGPAAKKYQRTSDKG